RSNHRQLYRGPVGESCTGGTSYFCDIQSEVPPLWWERADWARAEAELGVNESETSGGGGHAGGDGSEIDRCVWRAQRESTAEGPLPFMLWVSGNAPPPGPA